jgi:hypothetical protein
MDFSFKSYASLLTMLRESGYRFCDYHDYRDFPQCVIMRHDIDYEPIRALNLARLEAEQGVKATFFVLITSDFYNAASMKSLAVLKELRALGHEIGLHYDEVAHSVSSANGKEEHIAWILKEAEILSELVDSPITAVSMHRPSRDTLDADWEIPGMVNSYGKVFFRDFKYLSDSRRNWREPVMEIVRGREYDRLHVLTHAFWYHESDEPIEKQISDFILQANGDRYRQMQGNIRDLQSIMREEEIDRR